ncbi:CNNM domain-containing protein [Escherichia coli]
MSINRYKLRHLAQTKHKAARRVEQLLARPDRLLGLILIGNNLVNILASAIATIVCIRLFGDLGVAIATFGLTLVLVFGEVTPKTLAAMFPEKIAYPASWILKGLMVPLSAAGLAHQRHHQRPAQDAEVYLSADKDYSLNTEELRTIVNEAGNLIPKRLIRRCCSASWISTRWSRTSWCRAATSTPSSTSTMTGRASSVSWLTAPTPKSCSIVTISTTLSAFYTRAMP